MEKVNQDLPKQPTKKARNQTIEDMVAVDLQQVYETSKLNAIRKSHEESASRLEIRKAQEASPSKLESIRKSGEEDGFD